MGIPHPAAAGKTIERVRMQKDWAIDIDRDDITSAALVGDAPASLAPGQIRVAIDLFAMTANNITYAVFGKPSGLFGNDQGYWDFFATRGAPRTGSASCRGRVVKKGENMGDA